ncbi:erythromycin esterase family protein [Pseudoxanthomonas sp. PXM01]|uniref:erythromycin esterase family protein n=1 Tax=Pseudoxanthomonas sp. PXM01 TaxID=2769295 RepID=UPI0017801557|nr:erythromycin esterase family protein [Pseudoxanthomonas sp. PXM01]MBD9469343.1 erythromycin esterase family protein [Pseudoxanthomonas sp. PXM01]
MLKCIGLMAIALGMLASPCIAMAAAPPAEPDIDAVIEDLCFKRVVMLGEDSGHGAGATVAMKGRIMAALVERCGFDTIYFESPVYDFLDFEERLAARDASPALLGDAVGAIWTGTREFEPTLRWLWAQVTAGHVRVRGLDIQTGGVTQHFSANTLPRRLAAHAGAQRDACEDQLGRLTRWEFDASNRYDDAFRERLRRCLTDIEQVLATSDAEVDRASHRMAVGLRSSLALEDGPGFNLRDKAMAQNFMWHHARTPGERAILWTSTRHAVKATLPDHPERISLGMHLQEHFGDLLASIGFSAKRGEHGRPSRKPVSIANDADALEHRDRGTGYLDRARLQQIGDIASSVVAYRQPQHADWSALLDGIVLLPVETPLHALDATGPASPGTSPPM